ncbi:MAG: phosphatase PAP2 family protein [Sulfuricurvum sp.]|nr:phosphatase PAP2 family protein [Sulfuricurvum sp.]
MGICYLYVDRPVAVYFHSQKTSLTTFSSILTKLGEGTYYIVPSLILFLFFRKKNHYYAQISLFILASVSISGILVNILKIILGRFRPEIFFEKNLYGFDWFHVTPSMVSFPSGHSATALSAWLALAIVFPKYRIALLFIGIAIASTRIIITMHYCSDVIAGSALGIAVTMIYYHRFYLKNSVLSRA